MSLGHQLLIVAAVFQIFDAIVIVMGGALRGAGDTRWMMVVTFISAYVVFIPSATVLAFRFDGGALGAWIGAAVYIFVLSCFMWWRFKSERWRDINIFSAAIPVPPAPVRATQAAPEN